MEGDTIIKITKVRFSVGVSDWVELRVNLLYPGATKFEAPKLLTSTDFSNSLSSQSSIAELPAPPQRHTCQSVRPRSTPSHAKHPKERQLQTPANVAAHNTDKSQSTPHHPAQTPPGTRPAAPETQSPHAESPKTTLESLPPRAALRIS